MMQANQMMAANQMMPANQMPGDQMMGNAMMHGCPMMTGAGGTLMMIGMGIIWLLTIVALLLGIAALVKSSALGPVLVRSP